MTTKENIQESDILDPRSPIHFIVVCHNSKKDQILGISRWRDVDASEKADECSVLRRPMRGRNRDGEMVQWLK